MQICEQDTSTYGDQLRELLSDYCQWSNPGNFKEDELSPGYNYDYPFTMVAGYDGITTEKPDGKGLKRGDIYLDAEKNGTRYTWDVADIPETITVINGGNGYSDSDDALAIYSLPTDDSFDKERYPAGRPPRNFDVSKLDEVPVNLYLEIKTKDGVIVSAKVPEDTDARGWKDGDVIRVAGGYGDAELRVNIDSKPGWSRKFISKY